MVSDLSVDSSMGTCNAASSVAADLPGDSAEEATLRKGSALIGEIHRTGAGERPEASGIGSDVPFWDKAVPKVVISEVSSGEETKVHEAVAAVTENAGWKRQMSRVSRTNSSLDSGGSAASSIMEWARKKLQSSTNSPHSNGANRWGPTSHGPGLKPQAKMVGSAIPYDNDSGSSAGESVGDRTQTSSVYNDKETMARDTPKRTSAASTWSEPLGVNGSNNSGSPVAKKKALISEDVVVAAPKKALIKSKSREWARANSRDLSRIGDGSKSRELSRARSREFGRSQENGREMNVEEGKETELAISPVAALGGASAKNRWKKLSTQRNKITTMSKGTNMASQAVKEALDELDEQISIFGDLEIQDGDMSDTNGEGTQSGPAKPHLKRARSGGVAYKRQQSTLSTASRKSGKSVGDKSDKSMDLPSVFETNGVWKEDDEEPSGDGKKGNRVLNFALDHVSVILPSQSNLDVTDDHARSLRSIQIAWLLLRTMAVLFSLGTLIVHVLMQDQDAGELVTRIFASLACTTSIALAFLSGPPGRKKGGSRHSLNGDNDHSFEDSDDFDYAQSPALTNQSGQTLLHQARETLETAYAALASTASEMTLWEQLKQDQESLLRGFNKIVTQDVSLNRGKIHVQTAIVQESETQRKELEQLCSSLDYKVQTFPRLPETLFGDCPSMSYSDGEEDKAGVLKGRPGAKYRDWRNDSFAGRKDGVRNEHELVRVVLLGAKECSLPLPDILRDDGIFLVLVGTPQEFATAAENLQLESGRTERERWKAAGVGECMVSPFNKEAIRCAVMEAIHLRFREEFLLLENIGQGTWGNVFRAKRLGDGKVLALKMVNSKRLQQKVREAMEREVQLLRVIRWPTVLFLLDAWVSDQMQCLLLPLLDGGDLLKETTSAAKAQKPIKQDKVFEWYVQTLHGLCYLHWRGVVHADIKPSNLLLGEDKRTLMIGDFGSAMLLPGSGPHPARKNFVRRPSCTPVYASPESLLEEIHYASSDVWSVGASFFEVATLKCLLPAFLGDAKLLLETLNFEDIGKGGRMNRAGAAVEALRGGGELSTELTELLCRDPFKRPSSASLALRSKTSRRLQALLRETGALKAELEVDHIRDFAKLLVESEEAANVAVPDELLVEEAPKRPSMATKLRRSKTQPLSAQEREGSMNVTFHEAP